MWHCTAKVRRRQQLVRVWGLHCGVWASLGCLKPCVKSLWRCHGRFHHLCVCSRWHTAQAVETSRTPRRAEDKEHTTKTYTVIKHSTSNTDQQFVSSRQKASRFHSFMMWNCDWIQLTQETSQKATNGQSWKNGLCSLKRSQMTKRKQNPLLTFSSRELRHRALEILTNTNT